MQENIWGPLGIKDATFHPSTRPDMKSRIADQSTRRKDGKLEFWGEKMSWQDEQGNEASDCMGGQGSFMSAEEYIKVVRAVLSSDQDEKLLKKETMKDFFSPQLGDGSRAALNAAVQIDWVCYGNAMRNESH